MSKSLDNFITLESALDGLAQRGVDPAALRLYFVQTHYRSKIDYSPKGLDEAAKALDKLERTRRLLAEAARRPDQPGVGVASDAARRLEAAFTAAMDDDVHTPSALAALFDFARGLNAALEAGHVAGADARRALEAFESCGRVLTLFDRPVPSAAATPAPIALREQALRVGVELPAETTEEEAMTRLLAARGDARKAKDWARSDAIRDAAKAAGYLVEDAAGGQRWTKA